MGILDEIFGDLINPFGANEFLQQIQQAAMQRRNKGLREFSGLRFQEELEAELERIRQAQEDALAETNSSALASSLQQVSAPAARPASDSFSRPVEITDPAIAAHRANRGDSRGASRVPASLFNLSGLIGRRG